MSFITRLALRRRPVTVLIMIMLFGLGVYSYINLQRELFPDISFPNVAVNVFSANSDPETMMRDVSEPIEEAIAGLGGLREVSSVSTESRVNLLATFDFGTDMDDAEREVESAVNGTDLPDDVVVIVSRLTPDAFPVIQFTVSGDEDIPSLQRLVNDVINPSPQTRRWRRSDLHVRRNRRAGHRLCGCRQAQGPASLSSVQVSNAITQNNISLPAGSITTRGTGYPVRTANEFGSLEDIRQLTVGFEQTDTAFPQGPQTGKRSIKVSDVADVELTTADPQRISRANGKPGLILAIVKDPDSNTADVTDAVSIAMDAIIDEGALRRTWRSWSFPTMAHSA